MIVVRTVECAAIGALLGMIAAAPLIAILIHRGESADVLGWGALLAGVFGGCLWSLGRRPTLMGVAVEADRQLNLSELISSALLIGPASADAVEQSLRSMAEQTCAGFPANRVVVGRLGRRGWGGVAVGGALILSGLLLQRPPSTRASIEEGAFVTAGELSSSIPEIASAVESQPLLSDVRERNPSGEPSSAAADPQSSAQSPEHTADGQGGSTSSTDGAGGGIGQTSDLPHSAAALPQTAPPTFVDAQKETDAGSGDGQVSKHETASRSTTPGAGTASGALLEPSAPAWRLAPSASPRTGNGFEIETVPSSYRDLVREYFRRDR
jgi:hypothetical protein